MQNTEIDRGVKHLSSNDKTLSRLIKVYGDCNLRKRRNYFHQLTVAIISQQLSTKAANSIVNRFLDYYNRDPKPETIIETPFETLRAFGLSNAKAKYILDLAEKILDKTISLKNLSAKSNHDIIAELTKVKGIGVWTSHMFLIFTLNRLDVLPVGDLGIRKAIMLNYGLENLPDEQTIVNLAKKHRWHPYESIASIYFWKSLDERPETN
ncbi:MAG: DNA-3-methyladenine glycosylase [Melioribacteraceae bacterium]|nr:DNA-3-methyladenine glycosylase [Melioribacteraceae bacterium]MCF8263661.1 DNA-3-methyladenine glycosylase [Melioribacteraceae bacterium]MCF8412602.1 DNA-3-methyladenine glycosylase [Melioribacteraceae bacterium]MCF8431397.1 DNA-3-methyladenine glycosylase [Melioribacteraceae bacterium]